MYRITETSSPAPKILSASNKAVLPQLFFPANRFTRAKLLISKCWKSRKFSIFSVVIMT
jgi:hypothetical protein